MAEGKSKTGVVKKRASKRDRRELEEFTTPEFMDDFDFDFDFEE